VNWTKKKYIKPSLHQLIPHFGAAVQLPLLEAWNYPINFILNVLAIDLLEHRDWKFLEYVVLTRVQFLVNRRKYK
jgi:hypothetical protein